LQVEEPVSCRDCAAFHFHATLPDMPLATPPNSALPGRSWPARKLCCSVLVRILFEVVFRIFPAGKARISIDPLSESSGEAVVDLAIDCSEGYFGVLFNCGFQFFPSCRILKGVFHDLIGDLTASVITGEKINVNSVSFDLCPS
jgi:hypothetical protein